MNSFGDAEMRSLHSCTWPVLELRVLGYVSITINELVITNSLNKAFNNDTKIKIDRQRLQEFIITKNTNRPTYGYIAFRNSRLRRLAFGSRFVLRLSKFL